VNIVGGVSAKRERVSVI